MGFGARLGGGSWMPSRSVWPRAWWLLVVAGPVAGLLALRWRSSWWSGAGTRQPNVAGRAVLGSALGYALAFAVRLASALAMIALWALWVTPTA